MGRQEGCPSSGQSQEVELGRKFLSSLDSLSVVCSEHGPFSGGEITGTFQLATSQDWLSHPRTPHHSFPPRGLRASPCEGRACSSWGQCSETIFNERLSHHLDRRPTTGVPGKRVRDHFIEALIAPRRKARPSAWPRQEPGFLNTLCRRGGEALVKHLSDESPTEASGDQGENPESCSDKQHP